MPVDTDIRINQPTEMAARIRAQHLGVEAPTLVNEGAHRIPCEAARRWSRPAPGRHRAPEESLPGQRSTGPIAKSPISPQSPDEWAKSEGPTQVMPAVRDYRPAPLPRRHPGAAHAAEETPRPAKLTGARAVLAQALRSLRRAL
jgi:hypothetical protein